MNDNNNYNMEEIANDFEADNFEGGIKHSTDTLVSSLHRASELCGHNNESIIEAFDLAQLYNKNKANVYDFEKFEVDSESVAHATLYLESVTHESDIALANAKQMKSSEVDTYKAINKLVKGIGTAEDYKKVVF